MICSPSGSSVHGDSPGKNTGVGCHALLQGYDFLKDSKYSKILRIDSVCFKKEKQTHISIGWIFSDSLLWKMRTFSSAHSSLCPAPVQDICLLSYNHNSQLWAGTASVLKKSSVYTSATLKQLSQKTLSPPLPTPNQDLPPRPHVGSSECPSHLHLSNRPERKVSGKMPGEWTAPEFYLACGGKEAVDTHTLMSLTRYDLRVFWCIVDLQHC